MFSRSHTYWIQTETELCLYSSCYKRGCFVNSISIKFRLGANVDTFLSWLGEIQAIDEYLIDFYRTSMKSSTPCA